MKTIKHPIDVDPFYDEAQNFVKKISSNILLRSAILDDWNTGKNIKGARIIYGCSYTENCKSQCIYYSLFQTVGEDNPKLALNLQTALCQATLGQISLFPSKQKFLNCKSIKQYQESFIRWGVEKCQSKELLAAELNWIKGFRILFLDDIYDQKYLSEAEHESFHRREWSSLLSSWKAGSQRGMDDLLQALY